MSNPLPILLLLIGAHNEAVAVVTIRHQPWWTQREECHTCTNPCKSQIPARTIYSLQLDLTSNLPLGLFLVDFGNLAKWPNNRSWLSHKCKIKMVFQLTLIENIKSNHFKTYIYFDWRIEWLFFKLSCWIINSVE